jgi:hypothetical protein
MEIKEEFNLRFDYLQMDYVKNYDENEEDYLEIRVVKIPSLMRSLEQRMRPQIKLTPLQE